MMDKIKEVNIICDVAGQYETMLALLSKMPQGAYIQGVGDLIDRGPQSKQVVEFFMQRDREGTGGSLFGNHEHLMLSHYNRNGLDSFYDHGMWIFNGGGATQKSFAGSVPKEVLDWVEKLPLFKVFGDIMVAHSFIPREMGLDESLNVDVWEDRWTDPYNIIWSRDVPIRRDEYSLQIAGHNSQFGFKRFSDDKGEYAICLDSSSYKMLTGIHLPSMEIFQQKYIIP